MCSLGSVRVSPDMIAASVTELGFAAAGTLEQWRSAGLGPVMDRGSRSTTFPKNSGASHGNNVRRISPGVDSAPKAVDPAQVPPRSPCRVDQWHLPPSSLRVEQWLGAVRRAARVPADRGPERSHATRVHRSGSCSTCTVWLPSGRARAPKEE